jgi:hypothetical protein
MIDSKYSSDEILQILKDFYNCQSVFDPEVSSGEILNFETTISEWRSICDLVEPQKLANYYYDLFQLKTQVNDLETILIENKNQLRVFCDYISEHAKKQRITPVVIMGQNCVTASIFKTLMHNLQKRGVESENIRPSSKLGPLFRKHGSVFLEEVNKLVPGSLSEFEYRDNWIVRAGIGIILLSFLSLVVVPTVWHFNWILLIPLSIGITLNYIGKRYSPAKESISGYDTIRDLILGMEAQSKKSTD